MDTNNNFGSSDNGRIAGIISYFFILGWLIAYFGFHQNNRTRLGSFQLRQTLLFHIISMVLNFGLGIAFGAVWFATGTFSFHSVLSGIRLVLFVLWIIGLAGAVKGEEREIPLIGEWAQGMFTGI